MRFRPAAFLILAAPGFGADWNPRLAADYLDQRQNQWFAWPPANTHGVPCLSCHTGMTYLLARPALRRAIGESTPTRYETGLLDGLKTRVATRDLNELFPKANPRSASQALGVEAIFAALFLAMEDRPSGKLSAQTQQAFDRLWSLQLREGRAKGAWAWFDLDLDPWEMPASEFYGAALAALAAGTTPSGYQARPEVQEHIAALTAYLRNQRETQPLHNQLILLWASTRLPDALPNTRRKDIFDQLWQRQQADGGWTMESLGAWSKHADAPPSDGSNSYATALAAFVLQEAGTPRSHPGLVKALRWLRSHQDQDSGYWSADSMNKQYPPDSIPAQFMRDAATGFASLALLEADAPRAH